MASWQKEERIVIEVDLVETRSRKPLPFDAPVRIQMIPPEGEPFDIEVLNRPAEPAPGEEQTDMTWWGELTLALTGRYRGHVIGPGIKRPIGPIDVGDD